MQDNSIKADELKKQNVNNEKETIENASVRLFNDTLDKGERIITSFASSKKSVYFSNVVKPLLIFFVFSLILLFLYLKPDESLTKQDVLICLLIIAGITAIVETITILITKRYLKYAYYIVTNKRVIMCCGIFQTNFKSLDLSNIKDVELKWNFINKLMGKKIGQICFYSQEKGEEIVFNMIKNPLEAYIEIENILEKNNG